MGTLSERLKDLSADVSVLEKQIEYRGETLDTIAAELRGLGAQAKGLWDFYSLLRQVKGMFRTKDERIAFLERQLQVRQEQVNILRERLSPKTIERGDSVKVVGGWGPEGFPEGTLGVVKIINYADNTYYVTLFHEDHPSYWIDQHYLELEYV